jgi:two-component system, cell cycle sensor histidine kinase and response regulator CckA
VGSLGQPTILIVDDEEAVRSFAGTILRREGFHLVEAVDGVDALEKARQEGPIDLLLTDVRMPRMDGVALARALGSTNPTTPVIYISGYPFDSETMYRPAAQCTSLSKPFTRRALLDAVRKCLPAAGAGDGC